jgi:hypothetical protein
MEINGHWKEIRRVFGKAMGNYAIATVNEDGSPHVSPIGSVILRDNMTGFFFEEYPRNLPRNLESNNRVCILAVNFSKLFWVRSFLLGRYPTPVAVRIMGRTSERREATEQEIAQFRSIPWVWLFRTLRLKGYERGWKPLRHVRDIHFDSFEPVHAGVMTGHHWKG